MDDSTKTGGLVVLDDVKREVIAKAGRKPPSLDIPAVEITTSGNFASVIREVDSAMAGSLTLFQSAGSLVTLQGGGIVDVAGGAVPALLSERIQFMTPRTEEKEAKPIFCPPANICKAYHSRKHWALHEVVGVAAGPVWRGDGSILARSGYDLATKLYLPSGVDLPPQGDPSAAFDVLCEPLRDFPFRDDAQRVAAVALLLTLLTRQTLNGVAPMFFIHANAPGSGKGLLFQLLHHIANGFEAPLNGAPADNAEMEKRITAAMLEGAHVLVLDNVKGKLGGGPLERLLTAPVWGGRELGYSRGVSIPNLATIVATGNGATLTPDMAKSRTLQIYMPFPGADPASRKLPDVMRAVRRDRARLLGAAFDILRGYHEAGRPDMNLRPFRDFTAWGDAVRAPLVWCGAGDPLDANAGLSEMMDGDTDAFRALLLAWPVGELCRPGELADKVNDGFKDSVSCALREFVHTRSGKLSAQGLSKKFAEHRERRVAWQGVEYWLAPKWSTTHNANLWGVFNARSQ